VFDPIGNFTGFTSPMSVDGVDYMNWQSATNPDADADDDGDVDYDDYNLWVSGYGNTLTLTNVA
jgi:hypothetical protein